MQFKYVPFNNIQFPQDILYLKDDLLKITSNFKIKNENLFLKTDKKTKATVFKTSLENINALAKIFNENVIMIDSQHEGFYHSEGNYLLKFVKTGSLSFASGFQKTELQEIAVLLYLDNNLKELNEYKPSKNLNISSNEKISKTIEFLNNFPDWKISCLETAKNIVKSIPNYKLYELHHGTDLFKHIKRKGKQLSGVGEDKWNPSDIFLIKNSNVKDKLNKIENILDYNAYISKFEDIIGISLKKGDKEALHGAVALETIIKNSNLGNKLTIVNDLNQVKSNLKIQLKQIKYSPLAKYVYISKNINNNLNDCIDNLSPESKNFFKSLPLGVEFLTRICSNIELAFKTIKSAFLIASSKHVLSCSHLKAEPEKIFKVDNKNEFNFELKRIIIPVNGETNVIFAIEINNEPIKLQLRSKGTKPQFMIIKLNANKGKMTNIRDFD